MSAGSKPTGDSLDFDDMLDIVNPLHHIPIVGFIYRAITGDTISPASAMAGGALFGGPLGFIGALASQAYESIAEEPPLATVSRLFDPESPSGPQTAQAIAAYHARSQVRSHPVPN